MWSETGPNPILKYSKTVTLTSVLLFLIVTHTQVTPNLPLIDNCDGNLVGRYQFNNKLYVGDAHASVQTPNLRASLLRRLLLVDTLSMHSVLPGSEKTGFSQLLPSLKEPVS